MAGSLHLIDTVSQRLESFARQRAEESASLGDEASGFIASAASALAGGKRLRARFCHAGWQSVAPGTDTAPELVDVAASLEVFHAAALVHDDIIDNADTRRGRPAAHRALEQWHRDESWMGDAEGFGRASAILLGDLLVAWSDDLFEEGLGQAAPDRARRTRSEYALMRRDVTVGQFLDIAEESSYARAPDDRQAERALRVASYKSARYSVQQPLVIGATLGGADEVQLQALRDFGHPLGLAFQLRDDVLGVFGDEAMTGKPAGDDLREGKRTLLVAYARERLPSPARRLMDELLGDPGLEDEQIAALQRTIADTGALARVEDLITEYATTADRALTGAPLDNAAVGELRDLARAATQRSS